MHHKVFPGESGLPNNVQFWLENDMTIQCVSDQPLGPTERQSIQIVLGVSWQAGWYSAPFEERLPSGKILTRWSFLEPGDVDWN